MGFFLVGLLVLGVCCLAGQHNVSVLDGQVVFDGELAHVGAISADGTLMAVGRPESTDPDFWRFHGRGQVLLFALSPSSGSWLAEQTLEYPRDCPHAQFGASVGVSSQWVVVVARAEESLVRPTEDWPSGAVYVYRRTEGGWVLRQRIEGESWREALGQIVRLDEDGHVVVRKRNNNVVTFALHESTE